MPDTVTPTSMNLRAVSSELLFIAQYAEDVLKVPAPLAEDKARLKKLLIQAKADLSVVADNLASHLGVDPLIETIDGN